MSRTTIKWGQVVRYCNKHGFEIKQGKTGEKTIIAPKGDGIERSRQAVRISHLCCGGNNDELFGCYVSKLRNVLKMNMDELANM
jgi:hypothetical protein